MPGYTADALGMPGQDHDVRGVVEINYLDRELTEASSKIGSK
jgi:hypothetical protein